MQKSFVPKCSFVMAAGASLTLLEGLLLQYHVQGISFRISDLGPEKIFFDLNEAKELFNDYIKHFDKKYKDVYEYNRRLEIFTRNLGDVNNRNKLSDSEVYGITPFLDMTEEEFVKNHTGLNRDPFEGLQVKNDSEAMSFALVQNIPDHWDWRKQGVVTPIRDQLTCGSCWAFSVVGYVEGQHAIKHKKLHVLSEQQVLDCSGGGNCGGGFMDVALRGLAKTPGLIASTNYPYVNRQGYCRRSKNANILVKVKGGNKVNLRNEDQLKQLVYQHGPVAVGIKTTRGFMEYSHDVATPQTLGCNPNAQPDHAVVLVGYGTENGKPYWIIKNSHGKQWGEEGYMKLLRNANACSILSYIVTADVF